MCIYIFVLRLLIGICISIRTLFNTYCRRPDDVCISKRYSINTLTSKPISGTRSKPVRRACVCGRTTRSKPLHRNELTGRLIGANCPDSVAISGETN